MQVRDKLKRRDNINKRYSLVWILLSNTFNLGIAAIFLINADRMDILIYGRYTESIIGPLVLLGIIAFYEKTVGNKEIAYHTLIFCVLITILVPASQQFPSEELVSLTITGIYRFMLHCKTFTEGIRKTAIVVIFIVMVVKGLENFKTNKKLGFYIGFGLIGMVWILNAECVINNTIVKSQESYTNTILPIAEKIQEDHRTEKVIYIIQDREKSEKDYINTNIDRLQYLLWGIPIERVEISKLENKVNEKNLYFVLLKYSDIYETFKSQTETELICETGCFGLFRN